MIPFDFEYYKPTTISKAIDTFQLLYDRGKHISYYGGGTELITFARVNKLAFDAVIDIKGIPECRVLDVQGDQIVIGSAITLNKISESGLFPMLGQNIKQVADHTSRNKITIGGNLNSKMMYREGMLPLLLSDAKVVIFRRGEKLILPLKEVFHKKMELGEGDLLVQILIDKKYANIPFLNMRKTKSTKVGYPIVSIAALVRDKVIQVAFSGVCTHPFRSTKIEEILNDATIPTLERVNLAIEHLPAPIVDDIQGSSNYRKFVLKNSLLETMETLEEYII